MSATSTLNKISKGDLRLLYGVSHTTFIRWLRRAGLGCFVGRKKFFADEVVLIFKSLGKPLIARTAAQRLVNVYHEIKGWLSDELRFRKKYQRALPKVKQDKLASTEEEIDHPKMFDRPMHQTPQWNLLDALGRLRIVALKVLGKQALARQAVELEEREKKRGHRAPLQKIAACYRKPSLTLWSSGKISPKGSNFKLFTYQR